MSREKCNRIIKEAYVNYKKYIDTQRNIQRKEVQRLRSQGKRVKVALIELLSKEEFINKCKTGSEFSETWGLKIEERELSLEERAKLLSTKVGWEIKETSLHGEGMFEAEVTQDSKWFNIPTRLITITYNNIKTEIYE